MNTYTSNQNNNRGIVNGKKIEYDFSRTPSGAAIVIPLLGALALILGFIFTHI